MHDCDFTTFLWLRSLFSSLVLLHCWAWLWEEKTMFMLCMSLLPFPPDFRTFFRCFCKFHFLFFYWVMFVLQFSFGQLFVLGVRNNVWKEILVCEQRVYIKKFLYKPRVYVEKRKRNLWTGIEFFYRPCWYKEKKFLMRVYIEKVCRV